MPKQLVVIGGGAAGFFCAVNAARLHPACKVTLLEKHDKVLQKVKVSGGGRCNVTHALEGIASLSKHYPRGKNFLKKSFTLFSVKDTIHWFEERGVALKTEEDGRMFPKSDSSQTIIDCLLAEADRYHIELKLHHEAIGIKKQGNQFHIALKNKSDLIADYVFLAGGGYAKAESFLWLQELGHGIETPVPSLFTFNIADKKLADLMGVVVEDAFVKIVGTKLKEQGPVLFTHWGLSGPAVLRLSAWGARDLAGMNYQFQIQINWINQSEQALRESWNAIRNGQSDLSLGHKNPFGLPKSLWEFLLQLADIELQTKWSELGSKAQNKLIHYLTAHEIDVKGKTTFKKEFVTCGGIRLQEINPLTMESLIIPGLYFGGEIIDVDGITGGFNFQHAWTSGYVAAKAISEIGE